MILLVWYNKFLRILLIRDTDSVMKALILESKQINKNGC